MQTREETLIYLKAKRQYLMDDIGCLEKTLEHLNATIRMLEKETESPIVAHPQSLGADFPVGKLRHLTQLQAVIAIAKHQGGVVKAQDAKRLMIRAGVMRDTKNSTNITHNVIVRSEKFERIAPGEYRLRDGKPKTEENRLFQSPVQ